MVHNLILDEEEKNGKSKHFSKSACTQCMQNLNLLIKTQLFGCHDSQLEKSAKANSILIELSLL